MRRLLAALGAVVLIATISAPIVAAKPAVSFGTTLCISQSGAYSLGVSWDNVHGLYEVVVAGSTGITGTKTWVSEMPLTSAQKKAGSVAYSLLTGPYVSYTYIWMGLASHNGTPLVDWHYIQKSYITAC